MDNIQDLPGHWRDFFRHLGIHLIVFLAMGLLNLVTPFSLLWLFWLLLLWTGAVAIHFITAYTEDIDDNQTRDFYRHGGIMTIIIVTLNVIALGLRIPLSWTLFLSMLLALSVGIHYVVYLTEGRKKQKKDKALKNKKQAKNKVRRGDIPAQAKTLADDPWHRQLTQARTYQQQIQALIDKETKAGPKARMKQLSTQIDAWVNTIENLVQRVSVVQQNVVIQQDMEAVPQSIERLNQQLATETDEDVRADLARTLANRKQQLASLQQLQTLMNRAEIKMESALSSLGTIYSQLLTDHSANQVADYSHLSAEAEEETRLLQDHLDALTEVKLEGR